MCKKSKGHIRFIGKYELFEHEGYVYKAPIGNAIDLDTGCRHARMECKVESFGEIEHLYK